MLAAATHFGSKPECAKRCIGSYSIASATPSSPSGAGYRWKLPAFRPKGDDDVEATQTAHRKPGTKRHGVVERGGLPLASPLAVANHHQSVLVEALLEATPPVKQPNGRRRKRPIKLHAAKGDDYPRCPHGLHCRNLRSRIVRNTIDASERLGRHSWAVKRTHFWLNR